MYYVYIMHTAMDQTRGASDIEPETPESFEDQPTLPTAAVARRLYPIVRHTIIDHHNFLILFNRIIISSINNYCR